MASLGSLAIAGALALALYAMLVSLVGARLRWPDLVASGRNAALAVSGLYLVASATLGAAFLTHDFSLRYVYEHSSLAMPGDLVLAAFYSGQQGSLLYWVTTLTLFTAIVLWQLRRPGAHAVLLPYVVAVLMTIAAFMGLLLAFVATPFERLPFTPPDGVGLNPLLYDEGMRIHPPLLLAGYMSWSVPFAFAVAALATGRLDNAWVALARRYAMVAWLILGLGNLLGAWWAYRVLGWGGFWGWDPVENVALMPWLVGTAFIHSIQMQERRGMLKAWNVALIATAFFLSIFGTFVVRSGVLVSVHSFALSAIGPYFLAFLGASLLGFLGLFFWRLPLLRAENQLDSLLSREAAFLVNNLLLLGITFAIFWGTIYPLVSELVANSKIAVGAPYYRQVTGPLLGLLFLLMGVGPLMPWRRASVRGLLRLLAPPLTVMAGGVILLALAGVRSPVALMGFAACLLAAATIGEELVRGTRARQHATGERPFEAVARLISRNNRRYGGYMVHLALVMIGMGVIGSTVYQEEAQRTLSSGESMVIGRYRLTLEGLNTYPSGDGQVTEAAVVANGERLTPRKVFFRNFEKQPSTVVAIRSTALEDLYVVLAGWEGNGAEARVTLLTFVNPLVAWIWAGGLVLLAGTCLALWPGPLAIPDRAGPMARKSAQMVPAPRGTVHAST